jgi:hypothetical protein
MDLSRRRSAFVEGLINCGKEEEEIESKMKLWEKYNS